MTLVESWRKHRLVWLFVAILCVHVHGQNPAPVLESAHGPNTPGQEKKPYVVLVSLDGFRYDYTERYGA
jgi:predicted AlkP superfamily pyrophosphatase or phosphodiesterase